MFVKAIAKAAEFTRPIHTIIRNYSSPLVMPGAATFFFVNDDGWVLTARHVAEQIHMTEALNQKRESFRKELTSISGQKNEKRLRKQLEQKYQFSNRTAYEVYNTFINCVDKTERIDFIFHPEADLALLHFVGFEKLLCTSFPVFPSDTSALQQGKFLCRLGYPFAEFTNFAYDKASDSTSWTDTGRQNTPQFPIEGMVTRFLLNPLGQTTGFELSTPGLRGQSGGPAFDVEGKVWGMQVKTNHLDLDFDVDGEVIRNGSKKRVTESAFLNVGHCIHVDVMKDFMKSKNITFQEE